MIYSERFSISTEGECQIVDLSEKIRKTVAKSKIRDGLACVFIPGATGAITTVEYEPGLLKDLPAALERLFPKGIEYAHHQTWHDWNGHSHVRASMIGPSITIPIIKGDLQLGTWQQVVFIELDIHPRRREIVVQLVGE
ncbi:MAG TPA: YjbQ family protein [Thermoplasmata archaeon]|nr:YjbQ family protein [Thermoplasmata archaeon]